MGRERKQIVDKINELQYTIQDRLWKVFAYHSSSNRKDMEKWLSELNSYMWKLRLYNVPRKNVQTKEGHRNNVSRKYLLDRIVKILEPGNVNVLIKNHMDNGYPVVYVSGADQEKLTKLATKYVDVILSKLGGLFSVTPDELL